MSGPWLTSCLTGKYAGLIKWSCRRGPLSRFRDHPPHSVNSHKGFCHSVTVSSNQIRRTRFLWFSLTGQSSESVAARLCFLAECFTLWQKESHLVWWGFCPFRRNIDYFSQSALDFVGFNQNRTGLCLYKLSKISRLNPICYGCLINWIFRYVWDDFVIKQYLNFSSKNSKSRVSKSDSFLWISSKF